MTKDFEESTRAQLGIKIENVFDSGYFIVVILIVGLNTWQNQVLQHSPRCCMVVDLQVAFQQVRLAHVDKALLCSIIGCRYWAQKDSKFSGKVGCHVPG